MKRKTTHKLLSWLLTIAMLLGMLPISVMAEGVDAAHHQAGFADDGYYYTGLCTFTEGTEVTSEVPDQCTETPMDPVDSPALLDMADSDASFEGEFPAPPPEVPVHEHSADCYSVTVTEGTWGCERYAYATVTLSDPAESIPDATFRVVPQAPEYSEQMPTFTDADGVAPQSWVDEEGADLGDPSALTADTVAYALWSVEPPVANTLPVDTSAADFSIGDIRMDYELSPGGACADVGRTVVSVSAVPNTPFSPSELMTTPSVSDDWTYFYNGEAYFSPVWGSWFRVKSFHLRPEGNSYALYATFNWIGFETTQKVDSGNLRIRTDWPFSFYDMGSSGVTVMYSLDGETLQSLSPNETLHLFNNTDALNRVSVTNPDEIIHAFTKTQGIMFFVKAGPGFMPFGGDFSAVEGEQRREIFPLSQNDATNRFDAAISEALAQGYTHEFHYTDFDSDWNSKHGRRGFQINTQADENDYTITYVSGVDDGSVSGSTDSQQGKVNTELRISECGFSRVGYDFDGWTDANGKSYAPGDTYYVGQANLTLTATWKAQETTPITVNHYVKNGGVDKYALFQTTSAQASGTNLTQDDLLAQANGFVIPMEDTLGLAEKYVGNYYLAFKRAEVTTDANNGLVLNLRYNYIRFFLNTNGIPSGHLGGKFTGDIYGMVTPPEGEVWDEQDWYDHGFRRRQYAGNVEDQNQNVIEKNDNWTVKLSGLDEAAIAREVSSANLNPGEYGKDYTIRWHSVHEGNFIHVDGFVQALKAPPVTYHSNYPEGTGVEVTEELTAEWDDATKLWKHTVLNIDNEGMGMEAPANYFFVGWQDDQGNQYKVNESIIIGSSAHLYAQWSKNPTVTYQVTGDITPASFDPGAWVDDKAYAPGTSVKYGTGHTIRMHWNNEKTQLGSWKFSGWKADATLFPGTEPGTFIMPDQNVIFTGSWTFIPDTLAFYVREDGTIPTGELTTTGAPRENGKDEYTRIGTADMSQALIDTIIKGDGDQNPYYRSLLPVDYNASISFVSDDFTNIQIGDHNLENYTWYVVKNVGGEPRWHVDGVPTLSVTYLPGAYGNFDQTEYSGLRYGIDTPALNADGTNPISKVNGYRFNGWSPEVSPKVTGNVTYTAQWVKTKDFDYTVEYYYQQADGTYLSTTPNTAIRSGAAVGQVVEIEAGDKVPMTVPGATYVLDATKNDAWSGAIRTPAPNQDPGLALKVYFKLQFTVTYQPGDFGSFGIETHENLSYGDFTPAFGGQTTANGSYAFTGWNADNTGLVTGNRTYVAQWTYSGGGTGPIIPPDPGPGGGDGGGDGDTGGGTTIPDVNPPQGGTPDVTIPDSNIPQGGTPDVNIPDGNIPQGGTPDVDIPDQQTPLGPDDETIIVDEELPLGNLPQTGTIGKEADPSVTLGLLALAASLSAIGLSVVICRKREDESE